MKNTKPRFVILRVTRPEHKAFVRLAEALGISHSNAIRSVIRDALIKAGIINSDSKLFAPRHRGRPIDPNSKRQRRLMEEKP